MRAIVCVALVMSLLGLARAGSSGDRPSAVLRPAVRDALGQRPLEYQGVLELSLDEFVQMVLVRNLDLRIAEINTEITATGVLSAQGAFDPELYLNATGSDDEVPVATTFAASASQSLNVSTGIRGLGRTGLQYDLSYAMRFVRQKQTNPFFDFNPQLSSTVLLNLTQPLLRGAGPTITEATESQNRLLLVQGDYNLMWQVQQKAQEAIQAYWNLVFERRSAATAQTALEVAEELVQNNQRKLDAGFMTRLDVLSAKAEAARRDEALINANNRVANAEDVVKLLLAPGDALTNWEFPILPVTEAELEELPPISDVDVYPLGAGQSHRLVGAGSRHPARRSGAIARRRWIGAAAGPARWFWALGSGRQSGAERSGHRRHPGG